MPSISNCTCLQIGLAVGDIESVQRNARLKRLAMQVEHLTDLERKLPERLLQYVDKSEYKIYPNATGFFCSKVRVYYHGLILL